MSSPHSGMWHHYVPESGNWHDGTLTRWIAALSAAPNLCCHKKFSLRHPRYDLSATLRSLSEQPFDFTMHYNEHRESTYVMVNRRKDVAKHLSWAEGHMRYNHYAIEFAFK